MRHDNYLFSTYMKKKIFGKKNIKFSYFADKHLSKLHVNKQNTDILIPKILFVDKNTNNINFDELPELYVIKPTHMSGYYFIINKIKNELLFGHSRKLLKNISNNQILKVINIWMKLKYSTKHLEYFYHHITPQIIIEEYINIKEEFKFHIIHNKICFIEHTIDGNIYDSIDNTKFYTINWEELNIKKQDNKYKDIIKKNPKLDQFIDIVNNIINNDYFEYLRFDTFIDYENNLYFSEYTFSPNCFYNFTPLKFEKILYSFVKNKENIDLNQLDEFKLS